MQTGLQSRDAIVVGEDGYFPPPFSLNPMPDELRLGMIAPAFAGLLSAFATFGLISFIIFRIIAWRRHYRTFIGYNQYVMLVLNLLIADLQQASSFLISWYWINERKILAPSSACFAQGWLIHSGDLSSAFFVLAIAVHTFVTAILNITIGHRTFYGAILVIWFMAYLMTFIGVAVHPGNYFVRAGAWCWVSSEYENERLFLHYLWVFLVEFTTICLYAITFFALRMKTRKIFRKFREELDSTNPRTVQQVNKVTMLMMLYPCVYVLLTLPLSSGRMWSMAHNGEATSTAFSCAAGALLASCGWVDALLYTLTRKRLLHETMPKRRSNEIEEGAYTAFRTVSVTGQNTTPASAVEMNRFMKDRQQDVVYDGVNDFGTSTVVTAGPVELKDSSDEERSEKYAGRVAFREVMDEDLEPVVSRSRNDMLGLKEFLDQGPRLYTKRPPEKQSKKLSWPWSKR